MFFAALVMLISLASCFGYLPASPQEVMEASLVGTLVQPLRSKYTDAFDKYELRESRYG